MARPRKDLPITGLWDVEKVVARLHEAGLTDLNEKWVRNQADRGELPFVIVARRRRYRQDMIEDIIRQWCNEAA